METMRGVYNKKFVKTLGGLLKEYGVCGQLDLRGEGQPPQTGVGKMLDTQYLKV
jgi:hypothetical protein